jgi:uncharacterized protein (TIGR03000 family)
MPRKEARRLLLPLTVTASLLLPATPAPAQLLSRWGHPVISLGWTPYDSINVGHGNVPGGPGYIPGYGYYPGDLPGRYPWIDGPPTRAHGPAPAVVAPPEDAPPAGAAVLRVHVPAGARVWFSGELTAQQGPWRTFVTPPLAAGCRYRYDLRVVWTQDGKEVERTRPVLLYAGGRLTIEVDTQPE